MKRILIYIYVLAGIMSFSGCLDDENNYDYSEFNELEGREIGGMKNEYFLSYAQKLTITPTFEFTIDKENLDVSYEWRLDGVLLPEETGPSCTFCFERGGVHEVTYTVIDNKSGVKFSRSCTLRVRSPFTRGWLILREGESQESELSFVGASSVLHKMTVTDGTTIAEIDRDSLVYDQVVEKVSDGLGSNPVGLFLNAGYLGPYGEVFETSDEVGVMQDRWVELNGSTLERSVYTEDEFRGDLPEVGLHPQAAAMTFSAKALLNSDGYIYWAGTAFASDFHSCAYTSFPLGKDKKFKGVYPSFKLNKHHGAIPAYTADNEIVGIIDNAEVVSYADPSIKESTYSSGVHSVQTGEYEEDPVDDRYKLGNGELLTRPRL